MSTAIRMRELLIQRELLLEEIKQHEETMSDIADSLDRLKRTRRNMEDAQALVWHQIKLKREQLIAIEKEVAA